MYNPILSLSLWEVFWVVDPPYATAETELTKNPPSVEPAVSPFVMAEAEIPVNDPEAMVEPRVKEVKVMALASVLLGLGASAISPLTMESMLPSTVAGSELRTMVKPT